MSTEILQKVAETRRSLYVLNKNLPISKEATIQIMEHAVQHTPSSFNSQSTRLLALFGEEHEALWSLAMAELRKIVPENQFEATENKLNLFQAAAGSILFFEDQDVIKNLKNQFPAYGANFPVWADHANAMVQYAIWTGFAAAGIGANLQHYNPLIDAQVAEKWDIPATWTLRAQLVFGGVVAPAGEKTFAPVSERLRVVG